MPDDETYDQSAGPADGGTGDYEPGGYYEPGEDGLEDTELEDDGTLDASDTLEGDPGDDPLDQGIVPPDRWSAGERFGTTLAEERAGESLEALLAEEEPEPDPYADTDLPREGPRPDDEPEPRSGRLVAEDEGAHSVSEADLVARDVGIDAGAATAEEAAVHVTDEENTYPPGD
ncbi:MAG TPA: DUF5709 domain-containing protein [Streptosporangiaceae bacterium]|nr:DUF5709 domain-containing protein [Streptosporangiaceae bacterium]